MLVPMVELNAVVNGYVGADTLVSLIVTAELVAMIGPLVLSVLIDAVNVSAPSVVVSAVGVTEKLPALLVKLKLPLLVPKSPALVTV